MAYTGYSLEEIARQTRLTGGLPNPSSIGNINSPLLDLPLQNDLSMNKGVGSVTFSRASTATYIDRYGVLKYASVDEPRFEANGLLIEGASTNEMIQSNDFTLWSKSSGITLTQNYATAPDGTNTATLCATNTVSHAIWEAVSGTFNGQTYTHSIFIKPINLTGKSRINTQFITGGTTITNDGYIDWTTMEVSNISGGTSKITQIDSDWYRFEVTGTDNDTGNTDLNFAFYPDVVGTQDRVIWGSQQEEKPFATSYIPTTTSAVTRGADVCSVTPENNTTRLDSDFTIELGIKPVSTTPTGTTRTPLIIGSYPNSLIIDMNATNENQIDINYGGVSIFNEVVATLVDGADISIVKESTNMSLYVDGGFIGTTVVTDNTSIPSQVYIGSNTGSLLSGCILSKFKTYDFAKTATEVALS